MKAIATTLLLLCACCFVSLATDKVIIGVMPFRSADPSYKERELELQEIVTQVLSSNRQITLLDRSKVALLQKELDLQKNAEYLEGITVPQNKAYGAQVILVGTITYIDVEKSTTNTGKLAQKIGLNESSSATTFKSKINFSLQAFDVATGELRNSKTFSLAANDASTMSFTGYEKEGDAKKNAVKANSKRIMDQVRTWMNEIYPPVITIYKVEEKDKKGNAKFVSITTEEQMDFREGDVITVNELSQLEVGGKMKTRKVEIASLKVAKLEGDFTLCEVTEGGDILAQNDKWKSEHVQLLLKPKKK